jgi:hypothetical protein
VVHELPIVLWHSGQRLMSWAVANARVEPKGNAIIITKQASRYYQASLEVGQGRSADDSVQRYRTDIKEPVVDAA